MSMLYDTGLFFIYTIHTITWLLFAFSLVVDRDLLMETHTCRCSQIHVRSRQQTCFFFSHASKSFNKPFQILLYKTNSLHFTVCVYCDRPQKTSQRVRNNSHATRLCLVSYFLFFPRCYVICDLLQCTHTRKNVIYLWNEAKRNECLIRNS